MAKKGTGLLMVWADVPADKEEEFNRWYNEEHLPERMAIPGFLGGARYDVHLRIQIARRKDNVNIICIVGETGCKSSRMFDAGFPQAFFKRRITN